MPRPRAQRLVAVLLAVLLTPQSVLLQSAEPESTSPPTIEAIRDLRDQGEYERAAEQLRDLAKESEHDFSLDFVLLARAAQGHLDQPQVNSLFEQAIEELGQTAPTAESLSRRIILRAAIAKHFAGKPACSEILVAAFNEIDQIAQSGALPDPIPKAQSLYDFAVETAWTELRSQRPENAEHLYLAIAALGTDEDSTWGRSVELQPPVISLGLGWALAMQPTRLSDAAESLGDFARQYPDHADAPQAELMRIRCFEELGRHDKALAAIEQLVKDRPAHDLTPAAALSALTQHSPDDEQDAFPASFRTALVNWFNASESIENWPAPLVSHAIAMGGSGLNAPAFDRLVRSLCAHDSTGQRTAELLHRCDTSGKRAVSEQVAAAIISGELDACSEMALESTCRWAGRTGRWALLALAAESSDLTDVSSNRTVHVDRLFAEALTQTDRGKQAAKWWAYVVDRHDARDFPTLLRCAEHAIAYSTPHEAETRITQLRESLAASTDEKRRPRTNLVDVLEADFAVRRADLNRARTLYERVVRSVDSAPAVQGRAQWMIGETYFMQRNPSLAIDAYRKVDGIDPGGTYAAAALIQAGKSFEQLGRTREAGICYSTLIGRFADSPHATEARQRMAVLPSADAESETGNSPRLRR